MALGANPFGKDVANLALWRALARHGGYRADDVLTLRPTPATRWRATCWSGLQRPRGGARG
jgi:hypothetical protein